MTDNDCMCIFCNKKYKNKRSLWCHNNRFHNKGNPQNSTEITQISTKCTQISTKTPQCYEKSKINTELICNFCKKNYSRGDSLKRHLESCKIKIQQDKEKMEREEKEQRIKKLYDLKIKKEEAAILQLKLKLQNSNKVESNTLKRLNKLLLERRNQVINSNNNNNNSNNICNNTINNIQNNNYQIIGFIKDSEEIQKVLTLQEKRDIINSRMNSINKLIEIVHVGKYAQFKNIIITNLKDKYMYKYDDSKGVFVLATKDEVIHSLIDNRMCDLEVIYNELVELNKVDEKTKTCIERFINKMTYDDNEFTKESLKEFKINEIKMLLYNNYDKITNDIANDITLLLSAEEIIRSDNNTDIIDDNISIDIIENL